MSNATLLDIVKANGSDGITGLVDETIKAHPELALGAARTIKGINYKTLVRTALGRTTGSFRNANEGSDPIKNTYENRLVDTFILEPRIECDKAVADAYEDGASAFIAMEAEGVMEGEWQGICRQFYYGTNATFGNAKGFPGLLQAYDSANMVVDAAGTTNNTCSSVWFVKFGPKAVQWVWGQTSQPGAPLTLGPVRVESILGQNNKKLDGYVRTGLARPGLQVGSVQCVVRIKKLTADDGKGFTDDLIAAALAKFPSGMQPDVILTSRRSLSQLQQSRTATTPTGAPAPFPTEIVGIAGVNIPIKVTDAISDTETLTL